MSNVLTKNKHSKLINFYVCSIFNTFYLLIVSFSTCSLTNSFIFSSFFHSVFHFQFVPFPVRFISHRFRFSFVSLTSCFISFHFLPVQFFIRFISQLFKFNWAKKYNQIFHKNVIYQLYWSKKLSKNTKRNKTKINKFSTRSNQYNWQL